jgi:thiol-disulfide isomerase/thioredoxin
VLGNDQNITKDIQRWAVDADLKKLSQRNQGHKKQSSLALFDSSVNHTLDNLRENAVPLDPETFLYALEDHEYVFVDFYAGWCSHCKLLAPTWERFAEVMHDVEDAMEINPQHYSEEEYEKAKQLQLPVLISKVDCVAHLSFCRDQNIRGYPTLRLYVNGESYKVRAARV